VRVACAGWTVLAVVAVVIDWALGAAVCGAFAGVTLMFVLSEQDEPLPEKLSQVLRRAHEERDHYEAECLRVQEACVAAGIVPVEDGWLKGAHDCVFELVAQNRKLVEALVPFACMTRGSFVPLGLSAEHDEARRLVGAGSAMRMSSPGGASTPETDGAS